MRRIHRAIGRWLGLLAAAAAAGAAMTAAAAYLYLAPLLPSVETYRDVRLETPLRVYTADGRLIDEIGNRRDPVAFEDIPAVLLDALIATEDARFHSHPGVDIQSLLRGFYGFVTGSALGGGSTIAMQLANNLSFDSDNIYLRKLKEIPFALRIQRELTREEVLTLYLNTIYFGAGADGIGAAAFVYYGKEVGELTLAESAMMISLLPCPSVCNPLSDPRRAVRRRETRLRNMLNEGMIGRSEYEAAAAAPVTARRRNRNIEVPAPYVAEMVRRQLYDEFGEAAYSRGFEVVTSIDGDLQLAANRALVAGLEDHYDRRHGYRGPAARHPPGAEDPVGDWLERLAPAPVYGNQLPAIVAEVRERSFDALLKNGETVRVPWEGIAWARVFRSRDEAWPPPRTASDAVAVGDLIRVRRTGGGWELGQVPDIQGALVSLSPSDGGILALAGGYDFRRSQVNRVLTPRPPGSSFKPFVYGSALEQGWTAADIINDAPITRGDYRPGNYENDFLGPVTLRRALKESRNVPTVRLYDELGSGTVLPFAAKFGFRTGDFPKVDLTVALGSQDVQPLELAAAYAVIANGGYKVDPWYIREISSPDGGTLYRAEPAAVCERCDAGHGKPGAAGRPAPRVIEPRVAYILGSMLESVITEGSGNRVWRELRRTDLRGKTGTTNGPRELWFSGFNRDVVATVFVGFDRPEDLGEREQGATVAVPIWIDFMREALEGRPESTMARPDGIVDRLIDRGTGEPATPGDPNSGFEYFRAENAPAPPDGQPPGAEPDEGEPDEVSTETLF